MTEMMTAMWAGGGWFGGIYAEPEEISALIATRCRAQRSRKTRIRPTLQPLQDIE